MNYQRIYNELIADRRANPPADGEYVEVHHIVPRCMGGGDEDENLIRLTPEDHYMAHLLLAKAYGGRSLWLTVILMSADNRRELTRYRGTYGMARRKFAENNRGELAAPADLAEYTFYHFDGRVFTGTRIAFSEWSGVGGESVGHMVRGNSRAACGWSIRKTSIEEYANSVSGVAKSRVVNLGGTHVDAVVHHLYKSASETSLIGKRGAIRAVTGMSHTELSNLLRGSQKTARGWCVAGVAETAYDKRKRIGYKSSGRRFDGASMHFKNANTGEDFFGTIYDAENKYGNGSGVSAAFYRLVSGVRKSWRGWRIVADNDNAPQQNIAA